jgi:hypothetical protein
MPGLEGLCGAGVIGWIGWCLNRKSWSLIADIRGFQRRKQEIDSMQLSILDETLSTPADQRRSVDISQFKQATDLKPVLFRLHLPVEPYFNFPGSGRLSIGLPAGGKAM